MPLGCDPTPGREDTSVCVCVYKRSEETGRGTNGYLSRPKGRVEIATRTAELSIESISHTGHFPPIRKVPEQFRSKAVLDCGRSRWNGSVHVTRRKPTVSDGSVKVSDRGIIAWESWALPSPPQVGNSSLPLARTLACHHAISSAGDLFFFVLSHLHPVIVRLMITIYIALSAHHSVCVNGLDRRPGALATYWGACTQPDSIHLYRKCGYRRIYAVCGT